MPDRANIKKLSCPSCGAPITFDDAPTTRCEYCGSVLEKPQTEREQVMIATQGRSDVHWDETVITTQSVKTAGAGCTAVWVLFLLILVGGGAAAFFFMSSTTSSIVSEIEGPVATLINSESLVPEMRSSVRINSGNFIISDPGDGLPLDMIGIGYDSAASGSRIFSLGGRPLASNWESEPLELFAYSPLVSGPQHIFTVVDTELIALRRSDGMIAWRATLADAITTSLCDSCVQQVGDTVVALSQDGTLQAFNVADGTRRWGKTLREQPRQMVVLDGKVAVYEMAEAGEPVTILLFDPRSGEVVDNWQPLCPNDPFPSDPQGPSIYSKMIVQPEENALFIFGGFFEPGCIQRWDVTTGEMVWQALVPVGLLRNTEPTLVEDDLIIAGDDGVIAVAIADGATRDLLDLSDRDYSPEVLDGQGDTLLLAMTRRRGTQRVELWGVDMVDGGTRWQVIPQADELERDRGRIDSVAGSDDGFWTWQLSPRGVLLVQVRPDPARLVVETINWQDGTSSGQITVPVERTTGGSFSAGRVGGSGDEMVMVVDGKMAILNGATGELTAEWP